MVGVLYMFGLILFSIPSCSSPRAFLQCVWSVYLCAAASVCEQQQYLLDALLRWVAQHVPFACVAFTGVGCGLQMLPAPCKAIVS